MKPPLKPALVDLFFAFGLLALLYTLFKAAVVFFLGTPLYGFLYIDAGIALPWWLNELYRIYAFPAVTFVEKIYVYLCQDVWPTACKLYLLIPIIVAPVIEEIQYGRVVLWLLRRHSNKWWWYLMALISVSVFTAMHIASSKILGLGTLVLISSVSLAAVWLIKRTYRFWPAVAVHMLYNLLAVFNNGA